MTLYLLHLAGDGTAVGAWDETGAHYYAPGHAAQEARGVLRWGSRGSAPSSWEEYVEAIAGTVSPFARWAGHESGQTDLGQVLLEYNRDLVSPEARSILERVKPAAVPKTVAATGTSSEADLLALAQELLDQARNRTQK